MLEVRAYSSVDAEGIPRLAGMTSLLRIHPKQSRSINIRPGALCDRTGLRRCMCPFKEVATLERLTEKDFGFMI
jgi:hypothetical protein